MSDHRQPVQPLAETADTVTLRRADFEALLDEMEDAEDRIAVLESWVDELKDDGAGYLTPLTAEEVDRLLAGESPVKLWRDKRGMTQRDLAATAGISQSQVAEIETGAKTGSVETLRKLAIALKVQMESLVMSEPEPPHDQQQDRH